MAKGSEYVSIVVASYALVDVIKALADGGLTEYAITAEDSNLVLRIKTSNLRWDKINSIVTRSYVSR